MALTQLALFEGHEPSALSLALSGKITDAKDQPARDLRLGEDIFLLVVGKIDHVGFDDADPGPVRNHKVKVEQAYEVKGVEATELLSRLYRENRSVAFQLGLVGSESDDDDPEAKAS